MTSLQAVECYTSTHSETFEEILEWPYRRFNKAFAAWQKRNAVDEVEKRKNLHVAAMWGIVEWKENTDQEEAITNIENYYEALKNFIWDPNKVEIENQEMKILEESDPFLAAGKRNLSRVIPPKYPNEDEITNSMI